MRHLGIGSMFGTVPFPDGDADAGSQWRLPACRGLIRLLVTIKCFLQSA